MQVDEQFDYEKYINERLRDISDLDERRFAKELLLGGLKQIFKTIDNKYYQLERRILNEVEVEHNHYEVATTIIDRDKYDPLSDFLFPISLADVGKNVPGDRLTVYLEAEDQLCRDFLTESLTGKLAEDDTVYRFRVEPCRRYRETVKGLYQLYIGNQIAWRPIHTGYLERFFDLVIEVGEVKEGGEAKEAGGFLFDKDDLVIDWGRWAPYIREKMILLWNIKTEFYKVSNFMVPCLDGVHYECAISIDETAERGYLFEVGGDIDKILYEKDRVVVQALSDEIDKVKAYIIHDYEGQKSYDYNYPLFDNRSDGSFCGRYLTKTGVFLQTPADLFRKVAEYSGGYEVSVARYSLTGRVPEGALTADVNEALAAEVFPVEKRRILILYFRKQLRKDCYYDAQIRYILSRLQQEYLEYKCVGVYV